MKRKARGRIQAQGRTVGIENPGHGARVQFLDWLRRTNPDFYARVMSRVDGGIPSTRSNYPAMDGLGAGDTQPSLWERITSSISEIGTAYAGYKAQKEMLAINLERARAGQPPLDASSMAPVVRTQVDISPEIASQLRDAGTAGLTKMALYGGLALGAFLLLKK